MGDISVEDVSFAYKGTDRLILQDVSMTVHEGDFVCLLGQSGCGKSTFLRLLAGLEQPTQGHLYVNGSEISGAGFDRAVVFQDYGLFPWMTAGANLMLALKQRYPEKSKAERKATVLQFIREVGLDDSVFDKYPKELSGGMKQRCAIARAFSLDAPILLMDEPFGALDAVTRSRLQDMVLDLWSREEPKKTVFFVTHDVEEALLLATRVMVFGQSPSRVIYSCEVSHKKGAGRRELYGDKEVMELRNELIEQINQDVAAHSEQ